MKQFVVAADRLERAKVHARALADAWNSIPPEDAYTIRAVSDDRGIGRLLAVRVNPAPKEYSLLLGEMLYQLRSALDACVYQAAIYTTKSDPPPDAGQYEFPITSTPEQFKKLKAQKLKNLHNVLHNRIERLQPYNQPKKLAYDKIVENVNRSLSILNDLARKDRHRALHLVGSWPMRIKPRFIFSPGVTLAKIDLAPTGMLEENSVLASFRLAGYSPGMQISVNPHMSTNIGCNEPPLPVHANDTFDRRLIEMVNAVAKVIDVFKRSF